MTTDGGAYSPGIFVVPDDVRGVGRYVYELAGTLRGALSSAGSEVDSLTSGGWRGTLANEFADGWTDCHDGGVQIIEALTTMAEKLGVTADTYETADNQTSESLSSLLNLTSLNL